jgi:hypothetical protein
LDSFVKAFSLSTTLEGAMAFSDYLKAIFKGAAQGAKSSAVRQVRTSNNRVIQAGVKGWDAGAQAQKKAPSQKPTRK